MENFAELKLDWSSLPLPSGTPFPLVNMEDRKKISFEVARSTCYSLRKWNEIGELLADLLYYSWDDKEIKERLKKEEIKKTKEEQVKQFKTTLVKIAFSIARYSGCLNGVRIGSKQKTFYSKLFEAEANNGPTED